MTQQSQESDIRALIGRWEDAICKGDLDQIVSDRTADIVMFDVPEPLQEKGIDAYRDSWTLFFQHNPPGPDCFRISDLSVTAGNDVAVAHGLLTIGEGDAHCRVTLGLQKRNGQWRVIHEHHSMPLKLM